MRIDPFIIAIVLSIAGAYFFPQLGGQNSPIPLDTFNSIGVSLIFFFYGLKLRAQDIQSGIRNWQLHLIVQSISFLLFPLLVLCFYPFVQGTSYELLWLSLLFMAALPSTVSSSVVMVSMAKGNIPAAIFNASLSGIIGILITPLWMGAFVNPSNVDFDFTGIYLKLAMEILAPLLIGIALRPYWGAFARKNSRLLSLFDKAIILLIVYKSFVTSFEEQIFATVRFKDLFILFALVIGLFYFVYHVSGVIAKMAKLNRADRITVQFCGTKKSLVHGTVFSKALFAQSSTAGLMLLPLMLFHAFQILVISVYASKMEKEKDVLV